MPRRCSVAGCRSNYDSENEHTTIFSLPKDEPLRSLWLKKIPTDFAGIKNPGVCIKHFDEFCIIRTDKVLVKGELKEFPRERPKLKSDAMPTIFANLPKYLSTPFSAARRLGDAEEENYQKAVQESLKEHKNFVEKNTIRSLCDILKYFQNRDKNEEKSWIVLKQSSKLAICNIETSSECPTISGCIVVNDGLDFCVFINKLKVLSEELPVKDKYLRSVPVLEQLLNFVKSKDVPSCDSKLTAAVSLLKSMEQYEESKSLQFLVEQLILIGCDKKARRYSNQTMVFASCLYVSSSAAYDTILKCGLLCLPHPRNLRKLISRFGLNSHSLQGSLAYLKSRLQFLEQSQRTVCLLIDEIYIQKQVTFKGGSLYGSSTYSPSEAAKTAQVFMLSSICSQYRDVVSIMPVSRLTSEQLKDACLSVILEVEKLGFEVLAIVSDNNSVNRRAFELFTVNRILQPSVIHPYDSKRQLFFIFDTVHIMKCVRNNWEGKKDRERTITFPSFSDDSTYGHARFRHLEQMYEIEKNSIVKYGHSLSLKVLYPSNIQKQNVGLALRIFNENNVVALQHIAKQHPDQFVDVEETCTFIDVFVKFWKIVNVKSFLEGKRFNDEYREAVSPESKLQLEFLQHMTVWLKKWRQSVSSSSGLSAQTFQALINTIDAFLSLIPYVFDRYQLKYLLLSKFQNDSLESRFSSYRQLSGSNYFISYMQVLENERKIRFRNQVLMCSQNISIPLKTLLPVEQSCNSSSVEMEQFRELLELDFFPEVVPESALPVIVYIGGYTCRKVLRRCSCSICSLWLQLDKEVTVEDAAYVFTKDLDRGKLMLPTEYVVTTVSVAWFVMLTITERYRSEFLACHDNLSIFYKICIAMLSRVETIPFHDVCLCTTTLQFKLEEITMICCKIFLNNFVKAVNDVRARDQRTSSKIRKLAA